ncbi:MAG: hypothetical protein H3C46_08200 [Ignavibacteria bacterium]|nr:hypothetical protein [Ignavibacteria bacterium]
MRLPAAEMLPHPSTEMKIKLPGSSYLPERSASHHHPCPVILSEETHFQ